MPNKLTDGEIEITRDTTIQGLIEFPVILDVIQKLRNSGFASGLAGNCIAAAEMVAMMLYQRDIETTIVECQASVRRPDQNGEDHFTFVGFSGVGLGPTSVDTHVVVVTKGAQPVLIDLSIWQFLPDNHPFMVELVNSPIAGVIADYDYGDFRVTYTQKKDIRLPQLHQRSVMERLRAEEKITAKLKWVAYIAAGALVLSGANTILNGIVVYFRVIQQM